MSLFKQLLLAIGLVLLAAFVGSFVVSLESSRGQYENQLHSHAQDAASALALSLTPNIDDPAMVELMVSSLFDSGYYAGIRVVDLASGQPRAERHSQARNRDVPGWFVALVGLRPATAEAIVSRGWQQAARVEVTSHPMFALARLWQATVGTFLWLLLCGLLSGAAGAWLLRRQLRPLDELVEQSRAIARREFLALPRLPATPELRRVVQAMNLMVEKLRALFEEQAARSERLGREAYQDSLTGLANRRYFDLRLQGWLAGEERVGEGCLLLVRVNDLAGLNQRLGAAGADRLLQAVATLLAGQTAGRPDVLLARCRGGDFALLLPGVLPEEAEGIAARLDGALGSLVATGAADVEPVACIGLVPFGPGASPQGLMTRADDAVTRACSRAGAHWARAVGEPGEDAPSDQAGRWRERLDQALREDRFELFFQPVVSAAEPSRVLHHKVLARLPGSGGEWLAAGRFLPWIERFGWSARLDLAMLRQVLEQMGGHHERLALSLSGTALGDARQLEQVADLLARHRALGPRLVLELDETGLPGQQALERLAQRLNGLGFALGVQHFGGRLSLIGNLSRLGLAWLKVDGGHIRDIDREDDKRLFIEAVQRAAASIDLPLIAERVETEGERRVLAEMGFEGVQGRPFGEPRPWPGR